MSTEAKPPTDELKDLKIDTKDEAPLKKVDSAVQGMDPESPKAEKKHGRKQSVDNGVIDIKTLDPESVKFNADAIMSMGWKISSSTTTSHDKEAMKKPLTEPPVKAFEFTMALSETTPGVEFKVLKPKGVTIKDVMDKMSKKYKGNPDEDLPYGPSKAFLKGFSWNHHMNKFVVDLADEAALGGGVPTKKGKKKKGE